MIENTYEMELDQKRHLELEKARLYALDADIDSIVDSLIRAKTYSKEADPNDIDPEATFLLTNCYLEKKDYPAAIACAKDVYKRQIPKLLDKMYVIRNAPERKPYQMVVGLDYNFVEFQFLDLSRVVTVGIAGRERSGKTNLTKLVFDYCLSTVFDYPTKAYIIDDYGQQLKQFSSYGFVERYTVDPTALDVIFPEIEEELKHRKTMLQENGSEFLEQEPLIVCAIENQAIFENGTLSKQTIEVFKRIITSYKQLKVLFIFTNIPNVSIAYSSAEMLKQMKDLNTLFIMEDLSNAKLVDFNAAVLRQNKKPIELGDAYRVLSDGSVSKIRIVKSSEGSEE